MGVKIAKKLLSVCCDECRSNAIKAALSNGQLNVYSIVESGCGELSVAEIASVAGVRVNVATSTLCRLFSAGLVDVIKDQSDNRKSYYSVVATMRQERRISCKQEGKSFKSFLAKLVSPIRRWIRL